MSRAGQLAEHLAIRFALERFERGEVKATRPAMLDRMNQKLKPPENPWRAEDKMKPAPDISGPHVRFGPQFWAAVPEAASARC